MPRASAVGIPRTEPEIVRWLESLLSKQYDTEETAVHAIEEYRFAVVCRIDAALNECRDNGDTGYAFAVLQDVRDAVAEPGVTYAERL